MSNQNFTSHQENQLLSIYWHTTGIEGQMLVPAGPPSRSWICGRRAYVMGARKVEEMQVVLETLPGKDMRKELHPRSPTCVFQ